MDSFGRYLGNHGGQRDGTGVGLDLVANYMREEMMELGEGVMRLAWGMEGQTISDLTRKIDAAPKPELMAQVLRDKMTVSLVNRQQPTNLLSF